MTKYFLCLAVSLICSASLIGQKGHVLIMGGGFEESGTDSWAATAIRWGVEQSDNKDILIISQPGSTGGGMKNYISTYVEEAGDIATITITEDNADLQSTYDLIMQHDMIYFRGGNQYNYYSIYNNTKTETAVVDKFEEGGVISGTSAGLHILSEVIFTAELGTVLPSNVVGNVTSSSIKLADDFLSLVPGYLFDSHFVERGRFGRLVPFMANWHLETSDFVRGIGVDNKTAFGISKEGIGTAIGTGAVNIYINEDEAYQVSDGKLNTKLKVHQLLDGWQFDLNTDEVTSGNDVSDISPSYQLNTNTIYLTGSNSISSNFDFNVAFVKDTGNDNDNIIIVTGNNTANALDFESTFQTLGAGDITILYSTSTNSNSQEEEKIEEAQKIVFVDNSWDALESYLDANASGKLIKDKLTDGKTHLAFLGRDSRFAGESVISDNVFTDESASYDHQLESSSGLSLLAGIVILNDAFFDENYYQNTASAIPYFVVDDELNFGIWINGSSYMKYYQKDHTPTIFATGSSPVIILENKGTNGATSTTSATGVGSTARQVAGFEQMNLHWVHEGELQIGEPIITSVDQHTVQPNQERLIISPNPCTDSINLSGPFNSNGQNELTLDIYNSQGKRVHSLKTDTAHDHMNISLDEINAGVYMLRITNNNKSDTYRIIKR